MSVASGDNGASCEMVCCAGLTWSLINVRPHVWKPIGTPV